MARPWRGAAGERAALLRIGGRFNSDPLWSSFFAFSTSVHRSPAADGQAGL